MKTLFSTLALAVAVLLSSCATPSTPQTRIDANPAIWNGLSTKHKAAVVQGELEKGMTPPAVFLAWGQADQRSQGERNGSSYESWIYSQLRPTYNNVFFSSFGYGGFSRYGRGRFYNYGLSPRISYRKEPYARVEFRSGRVTSWERRVRR